MAHAVVVPAVPPGAVAEPEVGADDAGTVPVGPGAAAAEEDAAAAEEDAAEAEDADAAGAEPPLEGEEPQPAASVAARSAPPVNSPRWVRANSVIP